MRLGRYKYQFAKRSVCCQMKVSLLTLAFVSHYVSTDQTALMQIFVQVVVYDTTLIISVLAEHEVYSVYESAFLLLYSSIKGIICIRQHARQKPPLYNK